jgi:hypothetical protein
MKRVNLNVSISRVKSDLSLHVVQRTIATKDFNQAVSQPGLELGTFRIQRYTNHSTEMSGESSVKIPMGIKFFFSENQRPGCESDSSHSSNAEVRNVWSYTSILPYV